jgi:flavin reductase (DIM6/NTAB) family NADH-FMN oxidoreductase RutF
MPFNERQFRDALGRFPTGVVIVSSVSKSGEWLGMTVSSFNSVSLVPPLVLFSIARRSLSFDAWQNVDHFAISVLSEHQEDLSNRFARSLGEKWQGLTPIIGYTGIPRLPNTLVTFECNTFNRYDGGDHEIVVARVTELHEHRTRSTGPLVVAEGRYQRLATGIVDAPAVDPALLYGW